MSKVSVLMVDGCAEIGVSLLKSQMGFIVDSRQGSIKPENILSELSSFDYLVVRGATKITSEACRSLGNGLLAIGRAGAGVDNIKDIPALTAKGIIVFNAPGANSNGVAELTIAHLLALYRPIVAADISLRQRKWEKKTLGGKEVAGKILGIIGFGYIGQLVAKKALGLGMRILFYDKEEKETDLPVEVAKNLGEVLSTADVITLHAPENGDTKNMICAATIQLMKTGAIVINHARGTLVNLDDVAEALKRGKIAGFACDVYPEEPPKDYSIFDLPNTIFSPHLGATTDESEIRCSEMVARQILAFHRRGVIRNSVNFPDVDPDQDLKKPGNYRLTIIHNDVIGAIHQITGPLYQAQVNISDLMLRRQEAGGIVYTVIDLDQELAPETLQAISELPFIVRLRQLVL